MTREQIRTGGIIIGLLCLLAAAFLHFQDSRLSQSPQAPAAAGPRKDHTHPLVKEQDVGVLYKFNQETQDTLVAAVAQYCVKSYDRDSCIHHFSTCGHPCMAVIPKANRKRILDDYKALRKSRGLPDLKPLPKDD